MAAVESGRILLGSVGANRLLRNHPLGADFVAGLHGTPWPAQVALVELDWSPIAITQEWQAGGLRWERAVLIGAVDRGWAEGTVRARRWTGGALAVDAIQARIYEAVTGVVNLDNLLVIGAHFGIWPASVVTIEVQLAPERFGRIVAAEASTFPGQVVGSAAPDPAVERVTGEVLAACRQAVSDTGAWTQQLPALSATQLNPPGQWYRHKVAAQQAATGHGR